MGRRPLRRAPVASSARLVACTTLRGDQDAAVREVSIGPSLAAGGSIVVKPAKETTLTALRVAELAHEADAVPRRRPSGSARMRGAIAPGDDAGCFRRDAGALPAVLQTVNHPL
ncbi:hypothetical protein CUJ89_23125 [Burkholderia pyrrocinia]|uniref:Aldehyde dehydrogenase domain-containing protein n=1 Tax=Burkholderia pyrrocinia TaxID=60550 RepID=A0A2Z5N307_BURPY|nr:hypothetical protein CUJ89_23125 [Burkholderia pyrrocinia]